MARARTSEATVERGVDEIDFLGTRRRGVPLTAAVARTKTGALVERVVAEDSHAGTEAHDQGTTLIELYMAHADVVLGFRSFRGFLQKSWPLDLGIAYERMRVAKLVTRRQANEYGFSVCALGLRVMNALGETSFEKFLKTPLRLDEADGGGTVQFPAPANALRSVLRRLAHPSGDEETAPEVGETLRRYRATVDGLLEADPLVAAIKPVVWADAKGAYVRVTAGAPAELKTAAKLYERLARASR